MDLRYPIGPFKFEGSVTEDQRQRFIDQIEGTPAKLRAAVEGLSPEQLDNPYRLEAGQSGKWYITCQTAILTAIPGSN
jgi:hypothetical protein